MRIIDLNYLKSAIESITTCTSPAVQVEEIVAYGRRLNSPYASRHEVIYTIEKRIEGVLSAWNGKYHVHVDGTPPSPYPLRGYVREWKEIEVPTAMLQPLIRLATELGLNPKVPNTPLVTVYILRKVVAAWNYSKPIFWLSSSDINKTLANKPLEITIPPQKIVYRQGSLIFVRKNDVLEIIPDLEEYPVKMWWDSEWLFNHLLYSNTERTEYYDEERVATPVAVLHSGEPHAITWVTAPCKIIARDHPPITIKDDAMFLAIHPIPPKSRYVD